MGVCITQYGYVHGHGLTTQSYSTGMVLHAINQLLHCNNQISVLTPHHHHISIVSSLKVMTIISCICALCQFANFDVNPRIHFTIIEWSYGILSDIFLKRELKANIYFLKTLKKTHMRHPQSGPGSNTTFHLTLGAIPPIDNICIKY